MTGAARRDAARAGNPLANVKSRIASLTGWRAHLVAFLFGGTATLAFAPFSLVLAFVAATVGSLWLIDGVVSRATAPNDRFRAAAAIGWWFGFAYFLAGLYWVGYAFLVDADTFAWLLPFVAVLLPGGLALFSALAFGVAALLWRRGPARALVFAAVLAAFEWLRGHIFTGLPWNLAGYAWGASPEIDQTASVVGIYGLSLVSLLVAAAPATLGDGPLRARSVWGPPVLASAALALLWGLGAARLDGGKTQYVDAVMLRLVQPNIAQEQKWSPQERRANFERLLQLSSAPGADRITHIVWPEAATPFFLSYTPDALDIIGRLAPSGGAIITGTPRFEPAEGGSVSDGRVYNSVEVVAPGGTVVSVYDKHHLVPFGEYLPFEEALTRIGIRKLTVDLGSFATGPGPRTLEVPGAPPASPLVCYEAIFPGAVVERGRRPGWLLNVTNDAWFGNGTGPYQHLAQARMRAIEEGLPLVRSANTGISGIIDPYGRILHQLGLNEAGVIDSRLPAAQPPTIYARYGDAPFAALLFAAAVAGYFAGARERRRTPLV